MAEERHHRACHGRVVKMAQAELVWTFTVRGGFTAFRLALAGNPPLEHSPPTPTLWKFYGTETQAAQVETAVRAFGTAVTKWAEGETVDQRSERLALLGLGGELQPTSLLDDLFDGSHARS